MRPSARCICPTVTVFGEAHVEWPKPDCPLHGRPDTERFLAGDPLARHAKVVDRRTDERLTRAESQRRLEVEMEERGTDWLPWDSVFRDETPRETEARLIAELAA